MKRLYNKLIIGAFTSAALVAGVSSCSDDHFDINQNVQSKVSLWETINSQENLSEFASILKQVKYSKSEGTTTVQTYADLFSKDQTFTVWAPANGTFDYTYYANLLADGTVESAYKVEKELIRNNMARYSYVLTGTDSISLEMFNSKTAVFNKKKGTIKDQKIIQANIGANNGVLHITDGPVQYQPNIYEYLATRPELDSINTFIKYYDKKEFDEEASTQGPTVNGQVTWVDSVTFVNNTYLNTIRAYINAEDSSYAMIVPTNDAWKKALEKTASFYNYRDEYIQSIVTIDEEGNENKTQYTTTYTPEELDSIKNYMSKRAITDNLVFNAKYQYGRSFEDFAVAGACDSLTSTANTTFYDPESSVLFNGASPEFVSNGAVFIVDDFNFKPSNSWAVEREIEAEKPVNVESASKCSMVTTYINKNFVINDSNDVVLVDTLIQTTCAKTVQSSSASNPDITFKLTNTLSCKYDIYLLVAYNTEANKVNKFRAQMSYHTMDKATVKTETLNVPEGGAGSKTYFENRAPYIDENGKYQYVDSVLIAKDFEFPVAYQGVENAYATLRIQVNVGSKETGTYSREMWIDKIVLKAKDE